MGQQSAACLQSQLWVSAMVIPGAGDLQEVAVHRKLIVLFAVLCGQAFWAAGQSSRLGDPTAAIEFSRGQAAQKIGNLTAAIDSYRKAVILDPDWAEPLTALVEAVKSARSNRPVNLQDSSPVLRALREFYGARAGAAPENAVYQWAIGLLDDSPLQEMAERYFRSAIAIDPKFIKAYEGLAANLAYRGDLQGERECLNKLVELQPRDMDALALYAQRVLESDPVLARTLTAELLKVYHHPAGADLLARLAAFDANLITRIATLEQLKAWFPASENDTTEWNMRFLYDAYNRTDPWKALALAQEMTAYMSPRSEAGRDWQAMSEYQQMLMLARSLMDRKSYEEAIRELKRIGPPFLVSATPHALLQAQALDLAGKTAEAYQVLVNTMAAQPTDELKPALARYAEKQKKSAARVEADLSAARSRGAWRMPDFELAPYHGVGKAKLSQFRGRVVLLDFWHPDSITARDDLPHIKRMYDKYGIQGLIVITINTRPALQIASLVTSRYPFYALRAPDSEWAEREYGIRPAPYYLLLDRQGRAFYQPQFGSYDAQRAFELQVEAQLAPPGK
jgi:tetratricopeptide (TPR) repeat protein